MQQEPIIEFRHLERTDALINHINLNLERLEHFSSHIISCHIVIELEQNSQHKGKLFRVNITLGVPGKSLVVHQHDEDLYTLIKQTFDILELRLKEYSVQINRPPTRNLIFHGKIVRLIDNFGFIEDQTGEEFYFNEKAVLHDQFNDLNIGDTVEFHEFLGDKGPQAQHVKRSNYYLDEVSQQAN